ncbi:MAG: magnesium transporter [Spirochaetia bacterium]
MNSNFENFHDYLSIVNDNELKHTLEEMHMSEVLDVWGYLDDDDKVRLFMLMDLETKVDLINALSWNEQEHLIKTLSVENRKLLLQEMEPDDLADFIQQVPNDVRESVWNSLSHGSKQETQFLLRFDQDDAAGLMTPRYVAIRSNITVSHALQFIRKNLKDVETVYYIYVVDQLKRLQGVISLRDILAGKDDEVIHDLMVKTVVTVRDETDQEEVAKILEDHDFIALPVIDKYSRLLGIVTFDDIIDVIRMEQTEDIYKMGAMDGSTDRYLDTNVFRLVKKRIPWLTILLLAGTITTNVLHIYEGLILGAAFLSLFIPVITQTGGNSGTQSSTLMIRGLATGEIRFPDVGKVMLKELLVGVIMGLSMGIIILLRSMVLPPGIELYQAIAVGISLSFVVFFSTIIGAIAPIVIHKLGFDPTVMAGPLMATVIDVIGLTIYFETARLIMRI